MEWWGEDHDAGLGMAGYGYEWFRKEPGMGCVNGEGTLEH